MSLSPPLAKLAQAKRKWIRPLLIILLLPVALAVVQTSPLLARYHARRIVSGILGTKAKVENVECHWLRGMDVSGIEAAGGKDRMDKIAKAEIRLSLLPLFIGIVQPSRVLLQKAELNVPLKHSIAQVLLNQLETGRYASSIIFQNARITFLSEDNRILPMSVSGLDLSMERASGKRVFIHGDFLLTLRHSLIPTVSITVSHEGVYYRKIKEYLAESLNVDFRQQGKRVGEARLDRSARLTWNPSLKSSQSPLPTEIFCRLNQLQLPLPTFLQRISNSQTPYALSCDVIASISGNGQMIDVAGSLDYARGAGKQNESLWSDAVFSIDLPVRKIRSYSTNLRLLDHGRAKGKLRFRSAFVPDNDSHEGTISVENLDVPYLFEFLQLKSEAPPKCLLSVEQAWNLGGKGLLTATGEASVKEIMDAKQDGLSVAAKTYLRKEGGRIRGGWPQQRIANLRFMNGDKPLDNANLSVDFALNDPAKLNRMGIQFDTLTPRRYKDLLHYFPRSSRTPWMKSLYEKALSILPAFVFEGSANEIHEKNAVLNDFRIGGSYSKDLLEITTSTLTLASGSLSGVGACNLALAEKPLEFKLLAKDVQIQELRKIVDPNLSFANGLMNGSFTVRGLGASAAGIRKSLMARGDLTVSDPEFHKGGAFDWLSSLPGFARGNPRWTSLSAKGQWGLESVKIEQARLDGPDAQVEWKGQKTSKGDIDYLCYVSYSFDQDQMPLPDIPLALMIRGAGSTLHPPTPIRVFGNSREKVTVQFVLDPNAKQSQSKDSDHLKQRTARYGSN